jgi:two-component system, NtrC family, sensor kinase
VTARAVGVRSMLARVGMGRPHWTRRGGLFRKYATVTVALVVALLLANTTVQAFFSYQENTAALLLLQHEKATAATARLERFLPDVVDDMTRTMERPRAAAGWPTEQRRAEYERLFSMNRAIAEFTVVNSSGIAEVHGARLGGDRTGSDFSLHPAFAAANGGDVYFGSVQFAGQSEPHMEIGVPDASDVGGVVIVRASLKPATDIVAAADVGPVGHLYAVDGDGWLIADPDLSLVLRMTNLSALPQVARALDTASQQDSTMVGRNLAGEEVLSGHAPLDPPGWHVFAEQPTDVAFAPVRDSIVRSISLLLVGLALAVLASLVFARRMVRPIQVLQASTVRIGQGNLEERIELRTGDELERLADEFNNMTARLRESYATLEQKVEQRTQDLAEKSEQLEVVSRHKSEFLANMSHELRTPLNAIIGFSEVLSAQMFGSLNPKQAEYVTDVLESGRHLLALINDILDLAKVEAGRMELQLGTFSLTDVLERGMSMMQERAARRGVQLGLAVEPSDDGMQIEADEVKVKQIVFNLLSNAVKFTEAGGRVDVLAGRRDAEVLVRVRDTGIGIGPDDVERVFEEFEQVNSATSRSQEGTGLGLALTRRLVGLHGGRIWAESVVGVGSTFSFTLPVRGDGAGS